MKKRLLALLMAAAILGTMMLTGCASEESVSTPTESEASTSEPTSDSTTEEPTDNGPFPVSESPIDLTMVRLSWTGTFQDIDDKWKWQDYAEKTNVNVTFDEYPITSYQEELQLKLTTGDLPDAYYQMIFSNEMIFENGQNGNLIPLNDLIAEHAPNIQKMFEDYPHVKKSVTMPDGNIYSLPWLSLDKLSASVRTYVNTTVIDELGMEVPNTIDELTAFMEAMKEQNPEIYPLSFSNGNQGIFADTFSGAFGVGNAGLQGMAAHIDMGDDGNVRFYKTSDDYRAMLTQMSDWYKAGLIHPESFTTLDAARWVNMGEQNEVGVFCWVSPSIIGGPEVSENFTGISQFEGPNGDQIMSWIDADVRGNWSFMITSENENPIETIKWVDYWYSEEGSVYSLAGSEGVTYEKNADGEYTLIGDALTAYDNNELYNVIGHYGGFEPGITGMTYSEENQAIVDAVTNPLGLTKAEQYYVEDADDYLNYMPDDIWPAFTATPEEAEELTIIATEISTYLTETLDKFITGVLDVNDDTVWDEYISDLNSLGAERYLEIKQAQYERYANS